MGTIYATFTPCWLMIPALMSCLIPLIGPESDCKPSSQQTATDGGWSFGTSADPDATGIAISALANYQDNEEVAAVLAKGRKLLV